MLTVEGGVAVVYLLMVASPSARGGTLYRSLLRAAHAPLTFAFLKGEGGGGVRPICMMPYTVGHISAACNIIL